MPKKKSGPRRGENIIARGDVIQATIGNNATQVAVGKNIRQAHNASPAEISEDDLRRLDDLVNDLKRQIEQQAPPEKKAAALERVEELKQEITSAKPEPSTFEYIKNWFGKNLPGLLGGVTSLVVNPIVGKVVEATSAVAADAIRRKFGSQ